MYKSNFFLAIAGLLSVGSIQARRFAHVSPTLKVITGPMCCAKTKALIEEADRVKYEGKSSILFLHTVGHDLFEGEANVVRSRFGSDLKLEGYKVQDGCEDTIITKSQDSDVVLIDEAQFFMSKNDAGVFKLVEVVRDLLESDKQVVVAGLNTTVQGKNFGPMGDLLAMADEIDKRDSVCVECFGIAQITQMTIQGVPIVPAEEVPVFNQEEREALDMGFRPVCRKCFKKTKFKPSAAQLVQIATEQEKIATLVN